MNMVNIQKWLQIICLLVVPAVLFWGVLSLNEIKQELTDIRGGTSRIPPREGSGGSLYEIQSRLSGIELYGLESQLSGIESQLSGIENELFKINLYGIDLK